MNNVSNSIIKFISSYDSAGQCANEIDTILEYEKLGEYLSSGYYEDKGGYTKISTEDKSILSKLYNSLKEKFTNIFNDNNNLPEINPDNSNKYADLYVKLYRNNNRNELEENTFKKLQSALYDFATKNDYNLDGIAPEEANFEFIIKGVNKMIETKEKRTVLSEKTLHIIDNPYDNKKLESFLETYIKENNIQPLSNPNKDIDLGNGEFDKVATQKTNVCWALASINTLLTTDEGKKLLESNCSYDKNTGVFAIHLQEAEDNGFHDGVYIITPEEIQTESQNLVEGEGDAAAYLIAIKKYFEEVNNNPELSDKMESENHTTRSLDNGNYGFRFFEIITGGKFSKYDYKDIDHKLQNGIGSGSPSACGNYNYICDIVNNKKGVVVLSIASHAISVIGVKDNKLLIQESNNDPDFSRDYSDVKRNHVLFSPTEYINGVPTYELSQDDYEHYIQATSFLKWKD